ncbi:cytochrome P450 71A9 [Elaeis guineensis]|uniref:Cytochrome P450 71A1 n=1 Tax=Elaeis guineensis var. tenera TaxID=51953 RepID=A0A6I9QAU4_ELAGV|nr:cytochrome P450 71A1 [Elaeis guineensis]
MTLPSIMVFLPFLFLGLSFLSLLLLLTRKRKGKTAAPKLPPGPAKLPIIGNLHQLGKHTHHSLWQLSQQHGPLMYLKLGRIPTLVVSSPSMAREILKTHDHECCSRPPLVPTTKLSYGCLDVAFAPYGDRWRELRKVCIIELFSKKKVLSFRPIREEEIERTMKMISSCSNNLTPIDLSKLLFSLSGSIVCRTAFGRCYRGGEGSQFHKILKEAQAMLGGFFVANYLPIFGWVDKLTGMQTRLEKIFLELDDFYQQLIDEHIDPSRLQYDQDEDTIDALLRIQKDANYITQEHIKGVLMNIFIAGTDTSSSTVDWAMAELMRHPRVMKKAQDEVRGIVGRKGRVEESDLHQLHYIKSVVKEVMRLHPAAPLLVPRETMRHFMINGYDIPPQTTVIINAWAIGRHTNTWHMPHEFYPERFMDSSVEQLEGHGFELIPFGEGRRICPAKHLALLLVELVLANLLYCFDWELPGGMRTEEIDMDEATGITVHRKSSLCLVAKRYNEMDC